MTARLNQILAIEKGIKPRVYSDLTDMNKVVQKGDLFDGFAKVFQPISSDGEQLPPENKRVQFVAKEILRTMERQLSEFYNVEARKDWTNCHAKADVMIDDVVVIKGAPTTYLLFMEKQLTDLHTLASNLPVLDPAYEWKTDTNTGGYKAEPQMTHRTQKVVEPIVLYPATVEHPAQTQMIQKDVISGHWHNTKMSGAMPRPDKMALVGRIERLQQAVKMAREKANMTEEIPSGDIAKAVFNYLMPQEV